MIFVQYIFFPLHSQVFLGSSVVVSQLTNVVEPGTKSQRGCWGRRKFFTPKANQQSGQLGHSTGLIKKLPGFPYSQGSPPPCFQAQTPSLTNEVVPSLQNCRAYPASLGSASPDNPRHL